MRFLQLAVRPPCLSPCFLPFCIVIFADPPSCLISTSNRSRRTDNLLPSAASLLPPCGVQAIVAISCVIAYNNHRDTPQVQLM